MSIFSRTRKLVAASLHDWFDRLEDPRQMARQSLRELEADLGTAASATARSIAAQRLIERRRDELREQIERSSRCAAEAIGAGDEAAARQALVRQFKLTRSLEPIQRQLAEAADVNRTLRTELQTMNRRLIEAQDRLALQAARQTTAVAARQFAHAGGVGGRAPAIADLERTLDRVERATIEAEVQAELFGELQAGAQEPPDRREQDDFVEREIERLRKTPPA